MAFRKYAFAAMALLGFALMSGEPLAARAQEPSLTAPTPTVPEIFTAMGAYVRVAYNNEGYASLGYRVVQNSIGQEWVLIETGITVRPGVKNYKLKREHLSLTIPDGSTVPLATQTQFLEAGGLRALNQRAKVQTDSINYFPVEATRACPIRFFAQLGGPSRDLAWDVVELNKTRACIGRLFFHVPSGIQPGQYWFKIQFPTSVVEVPFRIFTDEEKKMFEKNWQDFVKEHEKTWK